MGPLGVLVAALASDRVHEAIRLCSLLSEDYSIYIKRNEKARANLMDDIKHIIVNYVAWTNTPEAINVVVENELKLNPDGVLSDVVICISEAVKAKVCAYYRINALVWRGSSIEEIKLAVPTILREEAVALRLTGVYNLKKLEQIELKDLLFKSRTHYHTATAELVRYAVI